MKKALILFFTIGNIISISSFAQSPISEFDKTVDSINAIIKASPLAYYMPKNQYSGYITKISASPKGIVHFTDSIPAEPKNRINVENIMLNRKDLISDCCPQKNSLTLDLFAINKLEIHFLYLNLKDKNNETFAQFIGLKKTDLDNFKVLLDTLKTLCQKQK